MSIPAAKQTLSRPPIMAAIACAIAGFVLFQFFGNATRGYVHTPSLFWWWISQWIDPQAESGHGWLILALSVGLFIRNLRLTAGDRPSAMGDRTLKAGEGRGARGGGEGQGWDQSGLGGHGIRSADPEPGPTAHRLWPIAHGPFPIDSSLAFILALLLHAAGFAAQQSRVSIVALLVFIWGVIRLAGGRRWGAAAVFPLGFMLFAIPVGMLDEIGLPLRLWVTNAGEHLAHAGGVDVVRNGTQLIAPDGHFNYDVAAPCSGVRSLTALAALSLLVGYLAFRSWWRRALVLLLCFPLVYAGNVARIVAIIFAAQWGGPAWGDRAHAVMGYGVFLIVLGGVLGVVAGLRRGWPERSHSDETTASKTPPPAPTQRDGRTARWTDVRAGTIAVLILAVAEMAFLRALTMSPPRGQVGVVLAADGQNPVELPAFLGTEWIGRRADVTAVERATLPADTGFSRKSYAFVGDRRRDVFLSIVLSGRDRTSIHRPELCLVGQGWTIEGAAQRAFQFPAGERVSATFPATVLRVRREVPTARGKVSVPQLVAYWFVGGDAIVSSHWRRFGLDVWNRLARGRADRWAYVLMQTDAADGEAAALARMQDVLDGTMPVFLRTSGR